MFVALRSASRPSYSSSRALFTSSSALIFSSAAAAASAAFNSALICSSSSSSKSYYALIFASSFSIPGVLALLSDATPESRLSLPTSSIFIDEI